MRLKKVRLYRGETYGSDGYESDAKSTANTAGTVGHSDIYRAGAGAAGTGGASGTVIQPAKAERGLSGTNREFTDSVSGTDDDNAGHCEAGTKVD